MFLAALMLASKYLQDKNYSAKAWGQISGLQAKEINANEAEFLKMVDWQLHVHSSTFERWQCILVRHASTSLMPYWRELCHVISPNLENVPDPPSDAECATRILAEKRRAVQESLRAMAALRKNTSPIPSAVLCHSPEGSSPVSRQVGNSGICEFALPPAPRPSRLSTPSTLSNWSTPAASENMKGSVTPPSAMASVQRAQGMEGARCEPRIPHVPSHIRLPIVEKPLNNTWAPSRPPLSRHVSHESSAPRRPLFGEIPAGADEDAIRQHASRMMVSKVVEAQSHCTAVLNAPLQPVPVYSTNSWTHSPTRVGQKRPRNASIDGGKISSYDCAPSLRRFNGSDIGAPSSLLFGAAPQFYVGC